MKYHEIGERFEYDGVVLEVVKSATSQRYDSCDLCYLYTKYRNIPSVCDLPCEEWNRKDSKEVYYKLVEQCNTKDMEERKDDKVGVNEYKALPEKETTDNNPLGDVCKAGDTFVCVRSVIDGDNVTRFTMGKIYECHTDNNLVNDNGTEEDWSGCIDFAGAFVKVEDGFNARPANAEIPKKERVNHPDYYNRHPSGVECITIIRHYNFNVGNAIKYLWRQGLKTEEGMTDKDKQIEDLKKAMFYIADEIDRLQKY